MTVPQPVASTDTAAVAPRKRRRRAPASGASDDCFACTKRGLKCDRRRPYCSQCLEYGKECSGYKTQLTWGVGVASRGKLRGLSLPVAKSAPAVKSPPISKARTSLSKAHLAKTQQQQQQQQSHQQNHQQQNLPQHPQHRQHHQQVFTDGPLKLKRENNAYTSYDFVNMAPEHSHPQAMQIPPMNANWNMALNRDYMHRNMQQNPMAHPESPTHQTLLRQSLNRLSTPSIGQTPDLRLSRSVDSISTYAESDYATSPIDRSFHGEDVPFMASPVPIYNNYSSHPSPIDHSPIALMDARGPTSCPDHYYEQSEISSSLGSHHNLYGLRDHYHRQHPSSPSDPSNLSDIYYDEEVLGGSVHSHDFETRSWGPSHAPSWASVTDDDAHSQAHSDTHSYRVHSADAVSSTIAIDMSPRIPFFLDYYEKIICPSIVVLDSPSNPYRHHILGLAVGSLSLRHAICALAACNLRMKRKTSLQNENLRQPFEMELQDRINRGSPAPGCSTPTKRPGSRTDLDNSVDDPSLQEEYQHRGRAVQLLNQQLGDPASASHDAVLATLFILCHYRMCESGVAQFQTQFAGVKKLMGIRQNGPETGKWGWMETLFTYFDAMTATVNDREAQLRDGFLEMIANPSTQEAALENLAGCDGRLFRVIAKLGRLNLLSQHRNVHNPQSPAPEMRNPPPLPRPRLAGQALADFYTMHSQKFDGNGFTTMLDDDEMASSRMNPSSVSSTSDEMRPMFWLEWKETRNALQNWEFDASRLVSILPVTPTPTQLRDFGYVSEAFRYAALLYTERLACPQTPSSALSFQNLVSQVLFYVTSLEQGSGAEFLLWPLFIAGSECVNAVQQSIVRSKCREITSRSGYLNNIAGLEVLEKLWGEGGDRRVERRRAVREGAFRWRAFMDPGDGEHIMI